MNSRLASCGASGAVVAGILLAGCAGPERNRDATFHYPHTNAVESVGALFVKMPPAVQRSVRAQAGAAEIHRIDRLQVGAEGIYQVTFSRWGRLPPLYVAASGDVLYPDFTLAVPVGDGLNPTQTPTGSSVRITELPEPVRQQLLTLAPTAGILEIQRELWGNRDVYIVTFAEQSGTPRLYISADGTVLTTPSSPLVR